jgi:hypothetical protein
MSTAFRSMPDVTPIALSRASSGRLLIIPCDGAAHPFPKKNPLLGNPLTVFVGTWADRCSSSKGTVVQELMYLIANQDGQEKVVFYVDGLGTRSGWLDKLLAG